MADLVNRHPKIVMYTLEPADAFPNNPSLPLLVYKHAFDPGRSDALVKLMHVNGWGGAWHDGVFSFHHYHSNAHEVLAVCGGSARLQFGGPPGLALDVEAGDVAILPAGTAHKNLGSERLHVVGAYPEGQEDYDMWHGEPGEPGEPGERAEAEKRIAQVPKPTSDPIYGTDGPLLAYW